MAVVAGGGAADVRGQSFARDAALVLHLLVVWSGGVVRADGGLAPGVAQALAEQRIDGRPMRAWPRRPALDVAGELVGAPAVWSDPAAGTRGAGATVCIVDTGLDLRHRDFLDAHGRIRVRWLLDLDGEPRRTHADLERGGGAVWSRDELQTALEEGREVPIDWHGHGTAVASAAAGDGADVGAEAPGAMAGIAPEAELVMVRALRRGALGFLDADLVRGARFCVDPRISQPERTVILLALGGHDGAHDGSTPLERALSALVAEGAAVVVAAGNDGARAVHASGRLVGREPVSLVLRVPSPATEEPLVAVVVRGANELRATTPGATPTRWVGEGMRFDHEEVLVDATGIEAAYVVWHHRVRAGDLVIEARGAGRAGATVHAWLVDERLGSALFSARFVGPSARLGEEVAVPATADGVVAAGALVSRGFLSNEAGAGLTFDEDDAGRALVSSRGPRVDGQPLPTLVAPGGWVLAALSRDLDPTDPEALFQGAIGQFESRRRGEERIAVAGTSISAAIVAGAIALARARSDGATIDERAALAASAARVSDAARVPFDPRIGWGQLDLPRYLAARERIGPASGPFEIGCTRAFVVPGARDVALVARAHDGSRASFDVEVEDADHRAARLRARFEFGVAIVPLALPPRPLGSRYDIVLREHDAERGRCTLKVSPDGAEFLHARAFGGGSCTAWGAGRSTRFPYLACGGLCGGLAWRARWQRRRRSCA